MHAIAKEQAFKVAKGVATSECPQKRMVHGKLDAKIFVATKSVVSMSIIAKRKMMLSTIMDERKCHNLTVEWNLEVASLLINYHCLFRLIKSYLDMD